MQSDEGGCAASQRALIRVDKVGVLDLMVVPHQAATLEAQQAQSCRLRKLLRDKELDLADFLRGCEASNLAPLGECLRAGWGNVPDMQQQVTWRKGKVATSHQE